MIRRLILATIAAAVVLIAVVAAAAYWFLSGDGVRRAIETQATAWLGQPVRIGAARAQLFPRLAIQLSDIHVGDAAQLALDECRDRRGPPVVLFFGRPAPGAEEGADRFDRLDVSFSLANRVLLAQAFSLHSPGADIVGSGSLNLETDALDGRVDVSLSEALSGQAGTDLYRYTREGNRVVLPASVGGTLAMPRLTVDAVAATRRGLRNEIERRMKGFLEKLRR